MSLARPVAGMELYMGRKKHKPNSAFLTASNISAMGNFQEKLGLPWHSHVSPRET